MSMARRFREILQSDRCIRPASVFDPLSIRSAAGAGHELAVLGGSVAALAVLGAPDHALLTLDEFAGLCRRICRRAPIPLMVDADHGYGNALNAMRCVEELETAGVAAMSLEDTALPYPFRNTEPQLISIPEAAGKIAAAVQARSNPDFAILGRTMVRTDNPGDLIDRVKAFAASGADAIFLTQARRVSEVAAVREATGLPIVLAAAKGELAEVSDLATLGVRVCLIGHHALPAALAAVGNVYRKDLGLTAEDAVTGNLVERFAEAAHYDQLIDKYLK